MKLSKTIWEQYFYLVYTGKKFFISENDFTKEQIGLIRNPVFKIVQYNRKFDAQKAKMHVMFCQILKQLLQKR